MKLRYSATTLLLAAVVQLASAQAANGVRFSDTTPAPPVGTSNVNFQHDSSQPVSNISAYVTFPTVQVACPASGDLGAPINACLASLPTSTGGTCDARACTAATQLSTAVPIIHANEALYLPCATLTQTATITIAATASNASIEGCAYSAGSPGAGANAGTLLNYTGSAASIQAGDPTHANYTNGLNLRNFGISLINATGTPTAIKLYAVERYNLDSLYISGNNTADPTGIYIDGTGWYSSGLALNITMQDIGTGYVLTGHLAIGARTDYVNFSTFIQNQIWCADNSGAHISGTVGVSDNASYGATWIGGGTFRCSTPYNQVAAANGLNTYGFNIYP
jgi:hypothetical protein